MNKYEQYKLDTKRFIIWLAVTARATLEGHLGEIPATLMTEVTLDLIRHQEAEEKGLSAFDASLIAEDFFGKTARSLSKFESDWKTRGEGYMVLVSGLKAQEIASGDYHTNSEHEFLAHYIQEASLEVVSHT